MNNDTYEERKYRDWIKPKDLVSFKVTEYETDLLISAEKNLFSEAIKSIKYYRKQLNDYIDKDNLFLKSFSPINVDNNAPEIVKDMALATNHAGVGPFAAVAGAMAEYIGKDLLKYSSQIIIENGGDIFMQSHKDRIIGVYAGESKLSGKIALKVNKSLMPVGICTSSGTVGHSKSFGKADAVIAMSKSTALADAVATATANLIQDEKDIEKAINFAIKIEGIIGIVAIKNDKIAIQGKFELVKI